MALIERPIVGVVALLLLMGCTQGGEAADVPASTSSSTTEPVAIHTVPPRSTTTTVLSVSTRSSVDRILGEVVAVANVYGQYQLRSDADQFVFVSTAGPKLTNVSDAIDPLSQVPAAARAIAKESVTTMSAIMYSEVGCAGDSPSLCGLYADTTVRDQALIAIRALVSYGNLSESELVLGL